MDATVVGATVVGATDVDATDVDAIAAGARVGTDTPTTTTNMPIHITVTLTTRTVRPMNTHISTDSDTGQGFYIFMRRLPHMRRVYIFYSS